MNEKYSRRMRVANNAKRLPIVFGIDISDSMGLVVDNFEDIRPTGRNVFRDQKIYTEVTGGTTLSDKLRQGFDTFCQALCEDDCASDSCEAAIITFHDTATLCAPFCSAESIQLPPIHPSGNTNLSPAIDLAVDLLEERKAYYKENRISYYQPWLILFTDGLPTDDVTEVKERLMALQNGRKLSVYTVALTDDPKLTKALSGFSVIPPLVCQSCDDIKRIFSFLSQSVSAMVSLGEPIIPKNFF